MNESTGAGRPKIGPKYQVSLPEILAEDIERQALAHHMTMSEAIRIIVLAGMENDPFRDRPWLSPGTKAAIGRVADYEVEREYGREDSDGQRGAKALAIAGITMDLHRLNADLIKGWAESHIKHHAHLTLRIEVGHALRERLCQHPFTTCQTHFEHDVPEIEGLKLCGGHYIDIADKMRLPIAE
jgi:hypothetical protein